VDVEWHYLGGDLMDIISYTKAKKVESQLAQNAAHINDISVSPRKNGARFDGITDDSQAIQTTINEIAANGGGDVLLAGVVAVGQTIELKSGVSLNCANATIKVLNNVNVIEFDRNTKIKGTIRIDVSEITYTKSVLRLNGAKHLSYRDITVDAIFITGNNASGMGNAIHLDCTLPSTDISFVYFGKTVIRGFEKGIFLDAPSTGDTVNFNYINGNIFDNVIISDCDYYIYGTGSHSSNSRNQVDGNQFKNTQLQHSNRAIEMIHLEGWGNFVEGTVWDAKSGDIFHLTETSRYTTVKFPNLNNPKNYKNFGSYNTIAFSGEGLNYIPYKDDLTYKPSDHGLFRGDYEDILHKADMTTTLNQLTGTENIVSGTSLNNVFNANSQLGLNLNLSDSKEYSFEIVFDKGHIGTNSSYLHSGFRSLGFYFMYNRCPQKIILEVTENTGTVTTTEINTELQRFLPAHIIQQNSGNRLGMHISKLKVTLIGQVDSDVRLGRIFGNSYMAGGNKYISNSGGKMAGRLEFITEGIVMKSPNGTRYLMRINDDGTFRSTQL
jgi:hypothetical protein